ncbi:hypothetical protein TVAG_404020 [Trichomonas vaginalis G3]|uniref:Uncharacterized protein n=1 Tax=Trichomonas vaginalis (strain ATCC PRA-98 / G3) TaxID=412133 RepID=A2EGF1_TRIV3|nr:hypothetical protein TVAG_404020 [Trichomonas vaginalis G3]|eukprot:XP_001320457.1 hypothetical protein [Trichomonas vaginalis G3]
MSQDSDAQIVKEYKEKAGKWTSEDLFYILGQPRAVIRSLRKYIIEWTINNHNNLEFGVDNEKDKINIRKAKNYYENVDNSFAYSLFFIGSKNFNKLKMPTLNKPDYSIVQVLHNKDFNDKMEGEFFRYIYNPYIFGRAKNIRAEKLYILQRYNISIFTRKDSDYKRAICLQIFQGMNTNVLNFKYLDCNIMNTSKDDQQTKTIERLGKFLSIVGYNRSVPIRYQQDYIPRILISLPKSEIFMHQTPFFRKYMLILNENDGKALIQNHNLYEFKKFIKTSQKADQTKKIDSINLYDFAPIPMYLPNALLNEKFNFGSSMILYIFFSYIRGKKKDETSNFYKNYLELMKEFTDLTKEIGILKPSEYLKELMEGYCKKYFHSNEKMMDLAIRPTIHEITNQIINNLTPILCRNDDQFAKFTTECSVLNLRDMLCGVNNPEKCNKKFNENYYPGVVKNIKN